jgi:hypothetical protein
VSGWRKPYPPPLFPFSHLFSPFYLLYVVGELHYIPLLRRNHAFLNDHQFGKGDRTSPLARRLLKGEKL